MDRKFAVKALLVAMVLMVVGPMFAQVEIPFKHWPALYDASKNLVYKRGVDLSGENTDKLYLRIGWGKCLAVTEADFREFFKAADNDEYTKVRPWADERHTYISAENNPDQYAEYRVNCPSPPLFVKDTWRNSRPTYHYFFNETLEIWQRGPKSAYRVRTDGPEPAKCLPHNARKDNGDQSNYWMLDLYAEVYDANGTTEARTLPTRLVALCEPADVPVEEHIF